MDWAEEQAEASGVPEKAGGILLEAPEPAPCQRRLLLTVPEKAGGILLEAPEPAPCQRRLLLTEDHADTRRLLGAEVCDGAELLEHLSAAVDEYRLAARGIAVRNGGTYDAVITDNQLPELCGVDVLAALQCARCPRPSS